MVTTNGQLGCPSDFLMCWSVKLLMHMNVQGWLEASGGDYCNIRACLLAMQAAMDGITNKTSRTMPFAYCHAFNLTIHLYLIICLFAWNEFTDSWIAALPGYFMVCFIVI